MAKLFKLSSWLGSDSPAGNDADHQKKEKKKKQNRRSFSGFSSVSSQFKSSKNGIASSEKAATRDEKTEKADGKAVSSSLPPEPEPEPVSTTSNTLPPTQSSTSTSQMIDLARKITAETEKLEAYMRDNGLPMPGFDVDAPADFPKLPEDIQESRQNVIHATKELRDLTIGPREAVRWGVWEVSKPKHPPSTSPHASQPLTCVCVFLADSSWTS